LPADATIVVIHDIQIVRIFKGTISCILCPLKCSLE
jgi:hypothetical protein